MPNIIVSIIGYLRRKSLEDQARKTTTKGIFFPACFDSKLDISTLLTVDSGPMCLTTRVQYSTSNILVPIIWLKNRLDLIIFPLLSQMTRRVTLILVIYFPSSLSS